MLTDGPEDISLSPTNDTFIRYETGSLDVTCSAQCWQCTYRWTGPNSYISNDGTLHLTQLNRTHHGQYMCTVINTRTNTIQTKGVTLQIYCKLNMLFVTNLLCHPIPGLLVNQF